MAEILDDVAYLSQEIGPRPAGTEEEQQAALYIADQVHERTHLKSDIEDIKCCSDSGLIDLIYFGLSFLAVLLSIVVTGIGVATLVVSLLCAVGFYIEFYAHRPLLAKLLARDVSQNVVVRYEPEAAEKSGSRRKIIVVANYDSGRVKREIRPNIVGLLGRVRFAANIAILVAPVILLFKDVVFLNALGFVGGFFTILAVIDAVLLFVPVIFTIIERTGAYNEAANVNASGVAALLSLIERVNNADMRMSDEEVEPPVASSGKTVVHGEQAARAAGVVPAGVDLVYEQPNRNDPLPGAAAMPEVSETAPIEMSEPATSTAAEATMPAKPVSPVSQPAQADCEQPEESATDRLLAAKAAIAALTGTPISNDIYAENLEETVPAPNAPIEVPDQQEQARQRSETRDALTSAVSVEEPEETTTQPESAESDAASAGFTAEEPPIEKKMAVPDWYRSAQEKAKKPVMPAGKVHRSRYADALDTAVKESSEFFIQANQLVDNETEARLRNMRWGISEVKVPYSQDKPSAPTAPVETTATAEAPVFEQPVVPVPVEPEAPERPAADVKPAPVSPASDPAAAAQPAVSTPQPEASAAEQPAAPVSVEPASPAAVPQPEAAPAAAAKTPATVSQPIAGDDVSHETTQSARLENEEFEMTAIPVAESASMSARERAVPFAPIPEAPSMEVEAIGMPDFLNNEPGASDWEQKSSSAHPIETEIPSLRTDSDRFAAPASDNQADDAFIRDDEGLGETIAMQPIPMPDSLYPDTSVASAATAASADGEAPVQSRVELPEVPSTNMSPIADTAKQRAPLAQAVESGGKSAAKSLLSHRLPKIDAASLSGDLGKTISEGDEEDSVIGKRANLMQNLPSLSGSITSETKPTSEKTDKVVSATGSFSAISASGSVTPVGDELVADVDPEDMYVEDADDSISRGGGITESGAYAGPDYVDMPKSRRDRFFDRFRRKKRNKEEYDSPQQWLDVDDGFDARSVGRARGDWSSFQEGSDLSHAGDRQSDGSDTYYDAPYDGYETYDANDGPVPNGASEYVPQQDFAGEYDDYNDEFADDGYGDASSRAPQSEDDRRWNGGAYSGRRAEEERMAMEVEAGNAEPEDLYMDVADDGFEENFEAGDVESISEEKVSAFDKLKGAGGSLKGRIGKKGTSAPGDEIGSSRERVSRRASKGSRSSVPNKPVRTPRVAEELQEIYSFADTALENEVWFVAAGAGESGNAGLRQFIDAHREELRGATIVNIEGLGAGSLGYANTEGCHKKHMPTTRLKRYLRTASTATGISLVQSDQTWRDSAAVVAMDAGISAVSIIGLDGNKPAFYAQSDDVVENIDEDLLNQNVNFLMEFLRSF